MDYGCWRWTVSSSADAGRTLPRRVNPAMDLPMRHRYTATAISLRWLIAIGIAPSRFLALRTELPLSPTKLQLFIRGHCGA